MIKGKKPVKPTEKFDEERLNDMMEGLEAIYLKCKSIDLETEALNCIKEKISKCGKEFDRLLEEISTNQVKDEKIIIKSMQVQGIISKMAHKIQRKKFEIQESDLRKIETKIEEKSKILEEKSKILEEKSETLEKEANTMKESVLTISSLVFTAFTFI